MMSAAGESPPDRPFKRVRQGTRSCVTCRRRKIRCIWSEGSTCDHCRARGLQCVQQAVQVPTAHAVRTTHDRLETLEQEVHDLKSALRAINSKINGGAQVERTHEQDHGVENTTETVAFPTAPSHLLQLFDNTLLDSRRSENSNHTGVATSGSRDSSDAQKLLSLLPSRQQMVAITSLGTSWITLYAALFPVVEAIGGGEDMLLQYDELRIPKPVPHPTTVACFLLSVATTFQQAPSDVVERAGMSPDDASILIAKVSDMVSRIILEDNSRACTVEGVKTAMLWSRLQLAQAKVIDAWLAIRRVIAVAELLDLPRAARLIAEKQAHLHDADSSSQYALWQKKAELWSTVCAVDRIASMMWSLPSGTVSYMLSKSSLLDEHGGVVISAFFSQLASIASKMQQLDSLVSPGIVGAEFLESVMTIHDQLETMSSNIPSEWWASRSGKSLATSIVQHWYHYVKVRTHLRLALAYDDKNQSFAHNSTICISAAVELACCYISLRPRLPVGFFASWIIDLQVFTGVVLLLLAVHRKDQSFGVTLESRTTLGYGQLIDEVYETMTSLAPSQKGTNFAGQASDSIRALRRLLQEPSDSPTGEISITLPLVGTIRVSHKHTRDEQRTLNQQSNMSTASVETSIRSDNISSDASVFDSYQYLVEPSDGWAFLNEDLLAEEQWLSWTE